MGKKGAKRKTRWRVLPIGAEEGGSGSGNEDDDLGSYSRATQKHRPPVRAHSGTGGAGGGGGGGNGYYNNKQHYHPRSYVNHEHAQPLVTTEKQIFNEEEYTKITTPRQDVLFKKGYLGRKRPVVAVAAQPPGIEDAVEDAAADRNEDVCDGDGVDGMDEQPQYIYTNGFVDQTGVYYINGSGYEMYDPYTGQVAVLVGPHYGHPGGTPALLAAVSCAPVPLHPLEWFNPPGFLPYAQAPCHGPGMQGRDRRKRYSTDSQNCSPVSSESTGPPGSPQESDETGRGGADPAAPAAVGAPAPLPMTFPHPPPSYVYPGYMFGAPMFNCNGVTVQSTPNQAPSSDVTGKRRKKKRKRRRKVAGEGDASEESSSEGGADDKDEADCRRDTPSQESSLESDSKHSASSEERYVDPPAAAAPVATALNPRATDFTCATQRAPNGLNVHVDEFEVKPVDNEVDYSETNGLSVNCIEFVAKSVENNINHSTINSVTVNGIDFEVKPVENEVIYSKSNGISHNGIDFKAKSVDNEVNYSTTNGLGVNGIEFKPKSVLNDRYSSINNKLNRQNEPESNGSNENETTVGNHVPVSSRPKLDFASVVSPKVNGSCVAVTPEEPTVDVFERYEDFEQLNGFAPAEAEDEWITVKPKVRKSDNGHGGQPEKKELTNGYGKPGKDHRQPNGRTYRPETRLYKADVRQNGKPDDRPKSKAHDGQARDAKPAGKAAAVIGKMEGNEGKERKTSSSSSEGRAEAAPVKPSRRERKNKSASPPTTPDGGAATSRCRPLSVGDAVVRETGPAAVEQALPAVDVVEEPPRTEAAESQTLTTPIEKALPKVPSLKDLSAKSIVHETPAVVARVSQTAELPEPREDVPAVSVQDATGSFLAAESASVDAPRPEAVPASAEEPRDAADPATPVPPPRRKKYRGRAPERAATPGKGSESDSSVSTASEASVIECLAVEPSDQSGLSSSDEEVIYSGRLGVEQPRQVGRRRVPRSTWTPTSRKAERDDVETPPPDETPPDVAEATRLAAQIVEEVIERAVDETERLKRPNLGITDAVTRWLRSQSPDVLSVTGRADEMADIREETEDELDDEDGSKNWQRDPLAAPSADGDQADKRVANKTADTLTSADGGSGNEESIAGRNETARKDEDDAARFFQEAGELEWDSWDLNATKADPGYDPVVNDTYQPATCESPAPVCPTLYDASVSVAKYYALAERSTSPRSSDDGEPRPTPPADERYRVSLATELARLQQPLPPTWQVAPLVVDAADSGVESGEDAVVAVAKKPGVFKRRLTGRLKGEGGPFPVGGVCCIVQ